MFRKGSKWAALGGGGSEFTRAKGPACRPPAAAGETRHVLLPLAPLGKVVLPAQHESYEDSPVLGHLASPRPLGVELK